jgi:hypothetical protein
MGFSSREVVWTHAFSFAISDCRALFVASIASAGWPLLLLSRSNCFNRDCSRSLITCLMVERFYISSSV